VIPTWNNLAFLKLCIDSIRKNSRWPHQIILHINDGSDGTRQWAEEANLYFTHTRDNVGICHALNAARSLVRTEYLLYMNDDMAVCPGWDQALLEEIDAIGHSRFFLSATMLEPKATNSKPVIAPRDYGSTPETFDEERLYREFHEPERGDWSGASRPPNLVPVALWDLVGGYSVEFSPGSYSDPDFSMKLWQAGVRHFRGVDRSRVYHFTSKSIERLKMNKGRKQFFRKWGITSSTLEKHLLRLGEPWEGELPDSPDTLGYRKAMMRNRLKTLNPFS